MSEKIPPNETNDERRTRCVQEAITEFGTKLAITGAITGAISYGLHTGVHSIRRSQNPLKLWAPVIVSLGYSYWCSERVMMDCKNPGLKIGRQWA